MPSGDAKHVHIDYVPEQQGVLVPVRAASVARSGGDGRVEAASNREMLVVVGGAGAMGRIIGPGSDRERRRRRNRHRGRRPCTKSRRRRLCRRLRTDARESSRDRRDESRKCRRRALDGSAVLIGACHHSLNLQLMDAAGCDRRMSLHATSAGCSMSRVSSCGDMREFKTGGPARSSWHRVAAPGIVNVMARDSARSVRARSRNPRGRRRPAIETPGRGDGLLETSYSIANRASDEASRDRRRSSRGGSIEIRRAA